MHLHIESASGIAGDMLLAALIDLGASLSTIQTGIASLPLAEHVHLDVTRVNRHGICAPLLVIGNTPHPPPHTHHDHSPDNHPHKTPHSGSHSHKHGPARCLPDLIALLEGSTLPARIQSRAKDIFERLAAAEGKIHGKNPMEIHFHEISGIDTIIDVVGCCLAVQDLEIDSISAGPVSTGHGFIDCAHGRIPLPAPATMELLKGIPVAPQDIEAELTTPTGAALLSGLATSFGTMPAMTLSRTGYGAGSRDLPGRSNTVRLFLGHRTATSTEAKVTQMTCSLDDCTGETIGYTIDRLLSGGALDAYARPVMMKKSRPGYELVVLCESSLRSALSAILFRETSTFGIRVEEVNRQVLARDFVQITIDGQTIRVKIGRYEQEVVTLAAEYEDCAVAAKGLNRSLREIRTQAERLARDLLERTATPGQSSAGSCYFSRTSKENVNRSSGPAAS